MGIDKRQPFIFVVFFFCFMILAQLMLCTCGRRKIALNTQLFMILSQFTTSNLIIEQQFGLFFLLLLLCFDFILITNIDYFSLWFFQFLVHHIYCGHVKIATICIVSPMSYEWEKRKRCMLNFRCHNITSIITFYWNFFNACVGAELRMIQFLHLNLMYEPNNVMFELSLISSYSYTFTKSYRSKQFNGKH